MEQARVENPPDWSDQTMEILNMASIFSRKTWSGIFDMFTSSERFNILYWPLGNTLNMYGYWFWLYVGTDLGIDKLVLVLVLWLVLAFVLAFALAFVLALVLVLVASASIWNLAASDLATSDSIWDHLCHRTIRVPEPGNQEKTFLFGNRQQKFVFDADHNEQLKRLLRFLWKCKTHCDHSWDVLTFAKSSGHFTKCFGSQALQVLYLCSGEPGGSLEYSQLLTGFSIILELAPMC